MPNKKFSRKKSNKSNKKNKSLNKRKRSSGGGQGLFGSQNQERDNSGDDRPGGGGGQNSSPPESLMGVLPGPTEEGNPIWNQEGESLMGLGTGNTEEGNLPWNQQAPQFRPEGGGATPEWLPAGAPADTVPPAPSADTVPTAEGGYPIYTGHAGLAGGGGGGGREQKVVSFSNTLEPYLKIIQLAFGGYKDEESDNFNPATNLVYNYDNTEIIGRTAGGDVFDLSKIILPGSRVFCTKTTKFQDNKDGILAEGDGTSLQNPVTWGMNTPEFPRFAIIDVFAARLPDNAYLKPNSFMTTLQKNWERLKHTSKPKFRPTRLIFIAGMYPNIRGSTTNRSGRGNICGNQDEIIKETSAGGGLCISFAIVYDTKDHQRKLRFIIAKAVRYMFRYQPNSTVTANSIGICTLDDNPCGTTGNGGASALSAHGFSFLYKTESDPQRPKPVEFDFIDNISQSGGITSTNEPGAEEGSSPYEAQLFFMDLVNDYINRKSLTAEPPEITRLVETRYIHFLKWASENGRIMNASTLMSRWWQGGNTAIEERAVSNDIQN